VLLLLLEPPAIWPGSGSECSPTLRENDIMYVEKWKNELVDNFGPNWEKFSICLHLAHNSVTTCRKDETKAQTYVKMVFLL
jgi:hypothetical protein